VLKTAAVPPASERLRDLVGDVLGLRIDDDCADALGDLVLSRMRAVGRLDLDHYAELLVGSTAEAGELARHLCINETYVLRHGEQFRALSRWLEARRDSGGPRMLSAGCSSGDEAFSLAILARQVLPPRVASLTEIVGVDLDPEAIRSARAGRLSDWSLRDVPAGLRADCFISSSGGHSLIPRLRELVEFRHENLVGPLTETWRPRSWDVIFCRNVLMYLTPKATSTLVARIADALVDGGLLFLGHAETLRGLSSDFDLHQEPGAFFYARRRRVVDTRAPAFDRAPGAERPHEPKHLWCDAIASSAARIEALSRRDVAGTSTVPTTLPTPAAVRHCVDLQRALSFFREDKFAEALHALGPMDDGSAHGGEVALMRALLLANGGRVDLAERECDAMLVRADLDAGAHYIKALCRDQANDLRGAIRHDRVAAYLDPTFAMPQLHAGVLLRRLGELEAASAALRAASRLLEGEETRRIVLFGGGFVREALVDLCRSELRACGGAK
jgi:chemotaxis protein methyltransferase CheR